MSDEQAMALAWSDPPPVNPEQVEALRRIVAGYKTTRGWGYAPGLVPPTFDDLNLAEAAVAALTRAVGGGTT